MDLEAATIHKICSTLDYQTALDSRINANLFLVYGEQYEYLTKHYSRHRKPPSWETFKGKFPEFPSPDTTDNVSELVEKLRHRRKYCQIQEFWLDSRDKIQSFATADTSLETKSAGSAEMFEMMRAALAVYDEEESTADEMFIDGTDFIDMAEDEVAHRRECKGVVGVPFYWDTITQETQGLVEGDICTVAARNGVGKTWSLLFWAIKLYLEYDYPIMWVSNEMTIQSVILRKIALMASIPYGKLKSATVTEEVFKTKMAALRNKLNKKGDLPFLVTSAEDGMGVGGVASVFGRYDKLLRSCPPGSKKPVIFIDGAYLLSDDRRAKDSNERVRNVVDDLKALTKRNKAVVILSWQLNRNASRGSTEERHLAYTDKINAHSSYMFSIERDEDMAAMKEAIIRSLKTRESGDICIRTMWNFDIMVFDEIEEDSAALPTDDIGGFTQMSVQ